MRRASPSVAYLNVEYQNRGAGLRIKAQVAAAWVQHTKTYGFSEYEYLDCRGDMRIRVQVQVRRVCRSSKPFPKELRDEGNAKLFHYKIADGNVDLSVGDFCSHLRWS